MIKVIELFAGIGAVHTALNRLNIEYEMLDVVEFDKKVIEAYNLIHNTNYEAQNVCEWDKDIKCDYLHASTPCQAFSVAGNGEGANDSKGRGIPLWEATIRIIKKTEPKFITLENVKGLLNPKHKELVDWYIEQLNQLGYTTTYQVINSKDFGVPQNRERVFFVSWKKELNCNFDWTFSQYQQKRIKDILEENANWYSPKEVMFLNDNELIFKNEMKQYNGHIIKLNIKRALEEGNKIIKCAEIQKQMWETLISKPVKNQILELTSIPFQQDKLFQSPNGISNTMLSTSCDFKSKLCSIDFNQMKSFNTTNGITGTLRAGDCNVCEKVISIKEGTIKYRVLTPRECFRLMDFTDEQFDKVKHLSTSRLTKLAGNSIVVKCIEEIQRKLLTNENKNS